MGVGHMLVEKCQVHKHLFGKFEEKKFMRDLKIE